MKLNFTILAFVLVVGISHADTLSYLRFEEGSGFVAWDETGLMNGEVLNFDNVDPGGGDTGYEGWSTSVSSATVPLTGEANTGSMRFGGSAFIDLSNANDLSLGMEFTIEMFMRPDNPDSWNGMFALRPASLLTFNLQNSSGDLVLGSSFQGNTVHHPAPLVQEDQWQHFALVMEPTEYSIYINGQVQHNGSLPSGGEGPYWFPGDPETGSRTLGDGWRGWLDEFRISDEALSPDQFLNASIPEPGTSVLIGMGLLCLIRKRRKSIS